jgi:two-component system sensor histidine kinase/response regulator
LFVTDELELLTLFAEQCGQVIDYALLLDKQNALIAELRQARGELEERVAQRTAALARSNAELEARNVELDAFAHTVAHDLKTPLSTLDLAAQTLITQAADMSPEEQRYALRIIAQKARKLDNIVDELLLLVEVRKGAGQARPLDMRPIVVEAQQRLSDLIANYSARIHVPDELPPALGHGPWMEEVWVNYLSNAFKYGGTPPDVQIGGAVQADGMVRFWVADHGPGIAPADQTELFVPFTRFKQVRAQGHGLGLSIVRHIVEKSGGQVGVESAPGHGSTFWFTLPAVAPKCETG